MMFFWILAAGLLGLALLFVLAPLLTQRGPVRDLDQDQLNLDLFRQQLKELDADLAAGELDQTRYKSARRDLERELLHDVRGTDAAPKARAGSGRLTAVGLALALPFMTVALYLYLGDTAIIPRLEAVATGQPAMPPGHPAGTGSQVPSLDVLVERLARKMEQNPDDLKGWLMLGRSYFATNQPEKAQAALERAYGLAPQDPEVVLSYAQALATNRGGKLAGQPSELVDKALAIDPSNVTGRWLQGLAAFQADDFAGAVKHWEGILANLDPQGKEAKELGAYLAEARSRGGMSPLKPLAPPLAATAEAPMQTAGESAAKAPAGSVTVQVSLADALRDKAAPASSLFIYAKAVSGPPMPLAVKRLQASDLPATVTLDDSMAMMPAMRLSNFQQVTVGARISSSGQAMPASGDLEGEVSPIEPGKSGPISVVIDRVRP